MNAAAWQALSSKKGEFLRDSGSKEMTKQNHGRPNIDPRIDSIPLA